MVTIKLNYEAVMRELDEVKSALANVKIAPPEAGSLGQNRLDFTTYWLEREARIHQLINEYVEVVEKNVEDTKANVRSLKEQDEAITRQ
ncbi:YwqI/YxiC family protein [Metabacillus sp. Hm71]|uniref:YwqI/YxiC family protein n=1 Tax=Metabacillus sp. Hm71 TaxID=3450743 RepID=UPI003F4290C2